MSKDKSHKKDKSKKHDLFSLMLEQSEVFREMVAHFQSAWAPEKFLNKGVEAISAGPFADMMSGKRPKRAAKSAKKPVAKVASTSKKVAAPTTKKPAVAASKSSVKKTPSAKRSKPVAAKKSAVKTSRRPTKKNSPKK